MPAGDVYSCTIKRKIIEGKMVQRGYECTVKD